MSARQRKGNARIYLQQLAELVAPSSVCVRCRDEAELARRTNGTNHMLATQHRQCKERACTRYLCRAEVMASDVLG